MSLLSSGLTGVAEEELEEVLGRSRSEDGSGGPPGGRESRVSLYEFSDPIFQVNADMHVHIPFILDKLVLMF